MMAIPTVGRTHPLARARAADLAFSALPDAPVVPERRSRSDRVREALGHGLRHVRWHGRRPSPAPTPCPA